MERKTLLDAARRTAEVLLRNKTTLAAAESCTGGLIASTLTDVPGSSDWFLGGVVAYANSAKENILGVPAGVLAEYGAVSEQTVLAMASGARRAFGSGCSLAVSGVAGPGGGTPDKPVGTVWAAWETAERSFAKRFCFDGDRSAVKAATVNAVLEEIIEYFSQQ